MCRATASTSAGSQSKSGKPCDRLTAPTSAASFDITVKMVVPTEGRRERSVESGRRHRISYASPSNMPVAVFLRTASHVKCCPFMAT